MVQLLYTNQKGDLFESSALAMAAQRGSESLLPGEETLMTLPAGATLTAMPGRRPLGFDQSGNLVPLKRENVWPVAALLPQGFTRTLLPAYERDGDPEILPLFGYTAVGMSNGKVLVAAVQTDDHKTWHPKHYNTPELPKLIQKMRKRFPENRLVTHLGHCSLEYGCFTAQNIFYHRWEGGLPVSPQCNANCVGCISLQPAECCPSPQGRIRFKPSAREVGELGAYHLKASGAPIISFGQGCEGEPSLAADTLAESIAWMRRETLGGAININTNGGYFRGIKKIVDSGLDAMRVSILSAVEPNYAAYYRTSQYSLVDVEKSIQYGVEKGIAVSLNLLALPGFTDRESEIDALLRLIRRTGLQMVQIRNLNIDSDFFYRSMGIAQEKSLGMDTLISVLMKENVAIGNYSRPKSTV